MAVVGRHELSDEAQLELLVVEIAKDTQGGDIFLLVGELGTGKTTFTKYFAQALGVKEEVTSPTFTIMGEYEVVGRDESIQSLVHIDLYRLEELQGEDYANIRDVIAGATQAHQVVVIEWADRLGDNLPAEAWKLHFEHGKNERERIVTITS